MLLPLNLIYFRAAPGAEGDVNAEGDGERWDVTPKSCCFNIILPVFSGHNHICKYLALPHQDFDNFVALSVTFSPSTLLTTELGDFAFFEKKTLMWLLSLHKHELRCLIKLNSPVNK